MLAANHPDDGPAGIVHSQQKRASVVLFEKVPLDPPSAVQGRQGVDPPPFELHDAVRHFQLEVRRSYPARARLLG
jgi:hypothetical protein